VDIMAARHNKGTWLTHAHMCARLYSYSYIHTHTRARARVCVHVFW